MGILVYRQNSRKQNKSLKLIVPLVFWFFSELFLVAHFPSIALYKSPKNILFFNSFFFLSLQIVDLIKCLKRFNLQELQFP